MGQTSIFEPQTRVGRRQEPGHRRKRMRFSAVIIPVGACLLDDILGGGQRRRRPEGGSDDRSFDEDEPYLVDRPDVDVRLLRDGVPYGGRRRHGVANYLAALA